MRPYTLLRNLERRFDSEIPDELWRAALAGGEATLISARARANSRCCDRLAQSAVRAAAVHRDNHGAVALWRSEGLAWMTGGHLDR